MRPKIVLFWTKHTQVKKTVEVVASLAPSRWVKDTPIFYIRLPRLRLKKVPFLCENGNADMYRQSDTTGPCLERNTSSRDSHILASSAINDIIALGLHSPSQSPTIYPLPDVAISVAVTDKVKAS